MAAAFRGGVGWCQGAMATTILGWEMKMLTDFFVRTGPLSGSGRDDIWLRAMSASAICAVRRRLGW